MFPWDSCLPAISDCGHDVVIITPVKDEINITVGQGVSNPLLDTGNEICY
jgi:hypothetical protein